MLELYNLSSKLQNENEDEDTRQKVRKLAESVKRLGLPMFPSKASLKRLLSDDDSEGTQSGPTSVHRESSDGGVVEQLKLCGFKVVPDVFETDGGTWELLDKVQDRNYFSIHDVALTLLCSYRLTFARCIDAATQTRLNLLRSTSAKDRKS